ncbi:MAG: hypothetical protein AAB470_00340 [Patescibacteria group bacterium]
MFFSHKYGTLNLVLDLQSSVVRGALVEMREGKSPLVLFTYDVAIPYRSNSGSEYLIKATLNAVNEVINETLKHLHIRSSVEKIPKKISEINYVLSSPWIISQARTLSLVFKKNTSVDKSFILDLIVKERSKILPKGNESVVIIEEKVFDVRLNGYSVTSWSEQEARNLEVSFVFSAAGKKIIEKLVKACGHAVHHNQVKFHSSLFLQHISIQKLFPDRSSYALVHIHGELTDVIVIDSQACIFLGSYPFGIRTIIRNLSDELKIDENTAESMLTIAVSDHFDPNHAKKESEGITKVKRLWIDKFQKLLDANPEKIVIPRYTIISAHSHEDFFKTIFLETYPLSLQLLSLDDVFPHIEYDIHAERKMMVGLYIIAIRSLDND